MSNIIRSLMIKVGVDLTEARAGLKQVTSDLKSAGKTMSSVGSTLTKGLTVPILGAVAGLGAVVNSSVEAADNIATLAEQTGLSTDTIQELTYAGTKLDVELETMTKSMAKNIKSMKAAQDGTKLSVDAYKKLGVEYKNADGSLRDSETVYWEVIDALGGMTNETERDALTMQLMGKSAQELNPLIKAGSAELANLKQEAHDAGAVLSEEAIGSMDEFGDELDAMKVSLKSASGQIAVALMPTLKKLLPMVKDSLVPAIKKLAEGLADIFEWFDDLSPTGKKFTLTLAGIAVGIGPALSGLGKMATGLSTVTSWLGKASKATTEAGGLGKALAALGGSAGPIAIAVAALGLAVGVAAALSKESRQATDDVRDLTRSIQESADASDEQINDIETETKLAEKLSDELYNLADKENLSNSEKLKMATIVEQLNQLIPDMNLSINAQTGLLNKNRLAVKDLIEQQKNQMLVNAYSDTITQAYKDQIKVTEELTEANKRVVEAQKEYDKWYDNAGDFGMVPVSVEENLLAAKQNVDELTASGKLLKDQIGTLNSAFDGVAGSVTDANRAIVGSFNGTAETVSQSLAEQKQAVDNYLKSVEDRTKEHYDTMGDINDYGIEQNKITAAKVQQNLVKQIDDFRNWRTIIKELSGKVPADVMAELAALGPEYSTLMSDLNQMTAEELNSWIGTWREKTALAADAAIEELGEMPGEAYGIGVSAAMGFINGLNSKLPAVKGAAQLMGRTAKTGLANTLEVKSPSKATERIGGFTGQGFINGMMGKIDAIKSVSRGMGVASLSGLSGGAGTMQGTSSLMSGATVSGFAQAETAGKTVTANQSSDLSESNRIMKQWIGMLQNMAPIPVNMDGKQVAEITFPWMMKTAKRQDKQWPVAAR